MSRHASVNRVYRLVWNQVRSAWVPVAETARGRGKSGRAKSVSTYGVVAGVSLALASLAHASGAPPPCASPACGIGAVSASSHPIGGQVVSGRGRISQAGDTTTIQQSSQNLFLDWLSFNVGSQETVNFVQPSANAIAVNEISSINGSQILGHLNANGEVWLVNPNGIVFGQGAQVNVGGLVASTLNEVSFNGNAASFSSNGTGSIENEGTINSANGGYVALLGNHVSNEGAINAKLGTVALGAGSAATLSFNGDSLVKMQVDQSTLKNLAENGGVIQADGGTVILSAGAKDALLASVVNNTGVIEARTVANHDGTIELLGGMTAGTVNVGGTLDASAPKGGNGGFIETNAAHVEISNNAKVTTAAAKGLFGTWLIDPTDFTVAPTGGDITGATLSGDLNSNDITILSSNGASPVTGGSGGGNINVNDTVLWSANTSLTLTAANNVNVNSTITANGATAGLIIQPNTANGSETASGTGTLNLGADASITLSGANAALSIATPTYTLGTGATINLPNVSPTSTVALVIGGTSYTVINTLGAPGSTTGTDLQGINVNLSGFYALGSNIDATATSTWNGGAGFTPIGNGASSIFFTGTFDGLGHTLSNVTINLPSGSYVGLFSAISSTAVIQNVGMINDSVSGGSYVGGLIGMNNYGAVNNSYATGSVRGSYYVGGLVGENSGNINSSYVTGNVNGGSTGSTVGGLVGGNNGNISNSFATGSVSGGTYVGGLAGTTDAAITNSYATGTVTGGMNVGGLVGDAAGSITGSYAAGAVSGNQYVGGLVGQANKDFGGGITNSYATGNVTNDSGVGEFTGGLVGVNYGLTITNSHATGNVNAASTPYTGGLVGSNFGTVVNSYATGNVVGLGDTGGLIGANYGPVSNSYATGTVSGMGSGGYGSGGLVGRNQNTITNSYATGSVSSYGITGGLVGLNTTGGTISNSYATGNVSAIGGLNGDGIGGLVGLNSDGGAVSNSYATGSVSGGGGDAIGGLVGWNDGVSTVSSSYATGSVTNAGTYGGGSLGGLVGSNGGTLSDSYATGNAVAVAGSPANVGGLVGYNSSGTINQTYAIGHVTNSSAGAVGGLVGLLGGGTVNNSFWDVTTSGQSTSAGGTALTTAQMLTATNLAGFNFTTTPGASGNNWVIVDTDGTLNNAGGAIGATFPMLSSEYSTAITNAHQLQLIAMSPTARYTLAQNIDVSASGNGTDVWSSNGFAPIGNSSVPFSGSFDGQGFTISNLTINLPSVNNVGLFGVTGASAVIQNVGLVGGSVTGGSNVGELAGSHSGTISNSYATGNVGGSSYVGGLVGYNNGGTISNSYATGSVSGSSYVGGLVGDNNGGSVINSLAGAVVSGNSMNGLIAKKPNQTSTLGGLVGSNTGTVTDSFWNVTTSGQETSAGGTPLTAAQMLNSGNFSGFHFTTTPGLLGNNWVIVDTNGTLNNAAGAAGATLPILVSEYSTTITNVEQLQLMAMNTAVSYTLGQNINASATGSGLSVWGSKGFAPIGNSNTPFSGSFNGNGHTISNLTIDLPSQNDVGLFGVTAVTSVIENVGLVNDSVAGDSYVGALVGKLGGAISTSYVTGTSNGRGKYIGGLAGYNNHGSVSNSYASGSVSVLGSSQDVGGLVGYNAGTVGDSYATASVSGASGATDLGGLVGAGAAGVSNSFWDITTSGQTTSAGGRGMTTAQMQTAANFTSATAANGNVNPNWDLTNTWIVYSGYTDPLLTVFLTPLTVTADSVTKTYNGEAFSGGTGVTYSPPPNGNLFGVVSYSGPSQGAVNAGTYAITPGGLYSNQQGYDIKFVSGELNIESLASETWTGGSTGNWSTAADWSSGFVPDYGNIRTVTIPAGKTVTYDSGVAGTTVLRSLTSSGTLVMAAGTLDTTGNLSANGFEQTGGTLEVGGSLTIHSSSGSGVSLGDITAGSLSVTSKTGSITQLASTALDVTGTSTLAADNGLSGANDVKYDITLANAANNFVGAVSSNGLNTDLTDGTGGVILGNTTATGTLTVDSLKGAITEATGKAIDVTGTSNLTANNSGNTFYNITLGSATNDFGGAVSAGGSNIDLLDGAGGLTLGNTTASGTLTATSRSGAITQLASTALDVTGTSTLAADNGLSGANDVKYAITLASATNNFVGAVSSNGLNMDLTDGTSGVILGNTTATGTLTVDSLKGAITEATGKAIDVTGTSNLTANNGGSTFYNITLGSATNDFAGSVTANGGAITLKDATALTAILDSAGASTLTSVGAMNVSGTVGTAMKTTTTGSSAATTFGATTVGTSLTVTSTGAVTETSANILEVDGKGTTTVPNTHVTVNGVKGVEIPAP